MIHKAKTPRLAIKSVEASETDQDSGAPDDIVLAVKFDGPITQLPKLRAVGVCKGQITIGVQVQETA